MRRLALYCIALVPLAVYIFWIWLLCLDIPYADDIDSGLLFAVDWLAAPNMWSRLELLFSQQTDHRIILNHIMTIGSMLLSGHVNFRICGLVGSLLVVGIGFLFYLEVRRLIAARYVAIVVCSYLLFQPQAFDSLIWSTASLANNGMVLAGMTALYLTSRARPIIYPLVVALMSAFTQAGGLAILAVSTLNTILKRRWFEMVVWSMSCIAVVLVFFGNYHRSGVDAAIGTAGSGVSEFLVYFLTWLGLAPGINQPHRALVCGLALLFFAGILIIKRYWNRSLFIWGTIIFIIALGALNSAARCSFGPQYALTQPRYRFFSTILLVASFIAAFDLAQLHACIKPKLFGVISILGAIVFWAHSTQAYIGSTFDLNRALTFEGIAWHFRNGLPLHPSRWGASRNLRYAVDHGVYVIPTAILERYHAASTIETCKFTPQGVTVEEIRETPDAFVVRGFALAGRSQAFIVAGDKAFELARVIRLDVARAHRSTNALFSGFMGYVLKSEVGNAEVSVNVCQ